MYHTLNSNLDRYKLAETRVLRLYQFRVVRVLPTDAACCPEIYIEDVVLSNKIGEIAENTAHTQRFLV